MSARKQPGPGVYRAAVLKRNGLGDEVYGVLRPDGQWRPGVDGTPGWHVREEDARREADELNEINKLTAPVSS